ncbi:MAG: MlaD family protein, partial [Nocardioides sp.]|nr:MlaD family protein [Nocardioides sp.]
MLTGRMKFQIVAFVVIAVCATAYLSVKYIGFNPTGSDYRVTLSLPNGGGSFTNGEVTYRGVPVGRIESMKTTTDGMEAVLRIEDGAPDIPADVTAKVANRSAIGEQYVDLRGESTDGDLLEDGDKLTEGSD